MNNDNLQTQCNSCGRPMAYCSCGGCNKCSGINFCEYGDKKCGCIRNQKPECPYTAVIPSVTVEDVSNIKDLADCFVHVSSINTTFYIDDKHRITSVWQGPVEVSNYDIEENPLNLRSQLLFDYETGYVVYFNAQGNPMNLNDIDAIVERLEPELQEKVNNKLNEMAEDGTLQEIIGRFIGLGALVCYDTVSDMISSTNLTSGAKVQTLGKYEKNDGYGAYYTISTTGNILLDNGLYATLVNDFGGNNYYEEVTYKQIRRYDTDCYITTIPKYDSNGDRIVPYLAKHDNKTPLEYAGEEKTTLTINASLTIKLPPSTSWKTPNMIGNGVILNENNEFVGSSLADNIVYLGFKEDGSIKEYKVNNTTAQMMLDDGVINAFDAYYKLVEHGVASSLENIWTNEPTVVEDPNPRQAIGVKQNGDIIIVTTDGRTGNDVGLTSAQLQDVMIEQGAYEAWNLDGGGSTSTSIKGSKVNRNIDSERTTERYINYTFNVKKETINEELGKAFSKIGIEKQNTLEQVYESVLQNRATDLVNVDLDNYTKSLTVAFCNGCTNRPRWSLAGYFINIPHSQAKWFGEYCTQFYIESTKNRFWRRAKINGTFTDWNMIGAQVSSLYKSNIVLSSTNNYETVNLSSGLTRSNSSDIIVNSDGTFSFTPECIGSMLTIEINGMPTTMSNGSKYIRITRNGTPLDDSVCNYTKDSANVPISYFTCLQIPENAGSNPDVYAVQIYGNSGDTYGRFKIKVSVD